MATAIAILCGVCLLLTLVCCVLAVTAAMAVAEVNEMKHTELDVPPIKWDYSREMGWVDAELEEDGVEE